MTFSNRLDRSLVVALVLSAVAFGALGVSACTSSDQTSSEPPTVVFAASEYAYAGPDSIASGVTNVELANNGTWPHQIQLARLEDGMSTDDLMARLASGEEEFPAWMTMYGGPNGAEPGTTTSAVVDLDAGSYVMMDMIPSADGVPQVALGMMRPLTVTDTDSSSASEPDPDFTITGSDFGFEFSDDLVAGDHKIRFENSGNVGHEVVLVKLADGASVEDYAAAFGPDAPPGPPPGQLVGGTTIVEPGMHNTFPASLEPGDYALVCFVPEGETPHFALGMMTEFQVQ